MTTLPRTRDLPPRVVPENLELEALCEELVDIHPFVIRVATLVHVKQIEE
jgi:hypothetical protein